MGKYNVEIVVYGGRDIYTFEAKNDAEAIRLAHRIADAERGWVKMVYDADMVRIGVKAPKEIVIKLFGVNRPSDSTPGVHGKEMEVRQ